MKKKKEEREMREANELQVESMAGKQTPETPEEGYVSSATEKDCTFPVSAFSNRFSLNWTALTLLN